MIPAQAMTACPLCGEAATQIYFHDAASLYLQCDCCGLVFLPAAARLSESAERAYYATHENNPADPHYRRFLMQLLTPLRQVIDTPAKGLDFGSGPGPTLHLMLQEAGFCMSIYDPLFAPDKLVLARQYDFITCSEVLEHVHDPAYWLPFLRERLLPGGVLAIMTGFLPEPAQFACWHYRRDPTHVCFYSPRAMCWLANAFGFEVQFPANNVALLRRSGKTTC